jgi:hypothetical protein
VTTTCVEDRPATEDGIAVLMCVAPAYSKGAAHNIEMNLRPAVRFGHYAAGSAAASMRVGEYCPASRMIPRRERFPSDKASFITGASYLVDGGKTSQ